MPEIPTPIVLLAVAALLTALGCAMLQPKSSLVAKSLSILPLLGGIYMLIGPRYNLLPSLVNSKIPDHEASIVYTVIWCVWGVAILLHGLKHKSVTGVLLSLLILVIGVAAAFGTIGNPDLSTPGQILDGVSNIIENIAKEAAQALATP